MMSLEDHMAFFEEEGYLVVEDLMSRDELAACQEEIERLHRVSAELEAAGDPAFGQFQREPYAEGANRPDGLPVLRKIEGTRDISDVFRNLANHPNLAADTGQVTRTGSAVVPKYLDAQTRFPRFRPRASPGLGLLAHRSPHARNGQHRPE